jgi:hypothetical protein
MSKVYISIGANGDAPQFEICSINTIAYPDGEMFAVFDEEDIAFALWDSPIGLSTHLENKILREAAKRLEELV